MHCGVSHRTSTLRKLRARLHLSKILTNTFQLVLNRIFHVYFEQLNTAMGRIDECVIIQLFVYEARC